MKKNKIKEVVGEVVEEVQEEVVEEVREKEEVVKEKELIKLVAQLSSVDIDGNKTVLKFEGEAETVEEAISQITLPKGINVNVKLTVIKGSTELLRSITALKARAIFENKNVALLKNIFRGIL